MKVFELMAVLNNLPAGMEVRAMDNANSLAGAGTINRHEVDGTNADGLVTLIYDGEKFPEVEN